MICPPLVLILEFCYLPAESGAVFTFGRSRFANNAASHFFIRNDPVVEMACGDEHTAVVCREYRRRSATPKQSKGLKSFKIGLLKTEAEPDMS